MFYDSVIIYMISCLGFLKELNTIKLQQAFETPVCTVYSRVKSLTMDGFGKFIHIFLGLYSSDTISVPVLETLMAQTLPGTPKWVYLQIY